MISIRNTQAVIRSSLHVEAAIDWYIKHNASGKRAELVEMAKVHAEIGMTMYIYCDADGTLHVSDSDPRKQTMAFEYQTTTVVSGWEIKEDLVQIGDKYFRESEALNMLKGREIATKCHNVT